MSKVTCEKTFVNNGIRSNRNIYTDFNNSKFFKIYTKLFAQFNPNQACVLSLIYDRISLSHKHPKQFYSKDKSAFFVIFSRNEIASKLSLSESTIGRIIRYLRNLGYLDTKRIYNGGLCIFCPYYKYDPKKRFNHTHSAKATKPMPHISYSSTYKPISDTNDRASATALHVDVSKFTNADKISKKHKLNKSSDSNDSNNHKVPPYLKDHGLLMSHKDVNIDPQLQKINNDLHKAKCRYTDKPNKLYNNASIHYVDPRKALDRHAYSFASLVDAFHGYRQYDVHHHLMVVPRDDAILSYMKGYPSVSEYTFAKIYVNDELAKCDDACSMDHVSAKYVDKLCAKYNKDRKDMYDLIHARQKKQCDIFKRRMMAYCQPRLDAYMHNVAVKDAVSYENHEDHDALRDQTRRDHYDNLAKHMHKSADYNKPSKYGNIEDRLQYAYNVSKSSHISLTHCIHHMFPTLDTIPIECKGIQGKHRGYVRITNAPNVAKFYDWFKLNHSAKGYKPSYIQDAIDNQYLHDCLLQRIKMPSNVVSALARLSHHCPVVAQTYIGILYESKYHASNAVKHNMKPTTNAQSKLLHDAFSFEHNEFYDSSNMSIARVFEDVIGKFEYTKVIDHWQSYLFTALEKFFEKAGIMYIKHHSKK